MDTKAIASELHRFLTGRKENKGAVVKIADKLGLSKHTVYDYLYGRIEMSLDFLKAAAAVTDDPDVKRFLEPDGMVLSRKPDLGAVTQNLEKEMNDIYLAVATLQGELRSATEDEHIDSAELARIKRFQDEVIKQTNEIVAIAEDAFKNNRRLQAVGKA